MTPRLLWLVSSKSLGEQSEHNFERGRKNSATKFAVCVENCHETPRPHSDVEMLLFEMVSCDDQLNVARVGRLIDEFPEHGRELLEFADAWLKEDPPSIPPEMSVAEQEALTRAGLLHLRRSFQSDGFASDNDNAVTTSEHPSRAHWLTAHLANSK